MALSTVRWHWKVRFWHSYWNFLCSLVCMTALSSMQKKKKIILISVEIFECVTRNLSMQKCKTDVRFKRNLVSTINSVGKIENNSHVQFWSVSFLNSIKKNLSATAILVITSVQTFCSYLNGKYQHSRCKNIVNALCTLWWSLCPRNLPRCQVECIPCLTCGLMRLLSGCRVAGNPREIKWGFPNSLLNCFLLTELHSVKYALCKTYEHLYKYKSGKT